MPGDHSGVGVADGAWRAAARRAAPGTSIDAIRVSLRLGGGGQSPGGCRPPHFLHITVMASHPFRAECGASAQGRDGEPVAAVCDSIVRSRDRSSRSASTFLSWALLNCTPLPSRISRR
jgi:hypothetical protein